MREKQKGPLGAHLCYNLTVRPKKPPVRTIRLEEHRLKGRRKGALLKEQIWFEDGKVTGYSLA